MYRALFLLLLASPACRETEKVDDSSPDTGTVDTGNGTPGVDGDGDGHNASEDCNDADAAIHPDAREKCDDVDNDCDGLIDDEDSDVYGADTWYADSDQDGFGGDLLTLEACTQPDGYVDTRTDCNDLNASIHPDADEVCDGADNNCDGTIDEDDALDASTWYADNDGDGYGAGSASSPSCDAPAGHVLYDGDCDDTDPTWHPGATESDCTDPNDYNCDGSTGHADGDGDGFAACEDCDDTDANANADATEVCDGIDNDCDGDIDAADGSLSGGTVYYGDSDGDGYGGSQYQQTACTAPPGYVSNTDDCDDLDPLSHPGASEVCDGADNDCDTDVDEGVGSTWYQDADSDGYGNGSVSTTACDSPSGYVANALDCDDFNAATNPSAYEICDGADNDCDGDTDESAINASDWYVDGDGDGYGQSGSSSQSGCTAPTGYVDNDGDCDDSNGSVSPGESEICDTLDNDCDGSTDESDAIDTDTFYLDNDNDGYGVASSTQEACSAPSGYAANAGDCNDSDAAVNPVADEVCDSVDNDCDGTTDEASALDAGTWYADGDNDGYGTAASSTVACDQPSGHVADNTDCNDSDGSISPGATESCDSTDNDCDGDIDENDAVDASTWYADADGDTFGDLNSTSQSCNQPSGHVADATDCDDNNASSTDCDSCLSWQTFNDSGDGIYNIDPAGTGGFDVYCNMSEDNGGWTLLFAGNTDDTTYGSGWNGWFAAGNTTSLTAPSSTGKSSAYDTVAFGEIRLTAGDTSNPTSAGVIIAVTSQTYTDMPTLVGTELGNSPDTDCTNLNGVARHQFTSSSRTGSYWQNDYIAIMACDNDGSGLESASGHYDAAVFSTYLSHGNYNSYTGDMGSEYRLGGTGSTNLHLALWVR